MDYMLGPGLRTGDADATLAGLAERLRVAEVPVDRMASFARLLHAEDAASARIWDARSGVRSFTFTHSPVPGVYYHRSPVYEAHRTRAWVSFRPDDVDVDTYEVVAELRADGIADYLIIPTEMVNGFQNSYAFASRRPSGFSDEDRAVLRLVMPVLAVCQEVFAMHRILQEVTRTYIGAGPQERILAGDVVRGEVTRIRSAILFADMRRFTELTAEISAEAAVALLNAYYDCVVPAIEAAEGEVLKFIGDGILAIFAAEGDGKGACARALDAAEAALEMVRSQRGEVAFQIGIGLTFGEVAYGNVGSGARLDYTVIGRDVNAASRIATLCGTLGAPLLMSDEFPRRLPGRAFAARGVHFLRGLGDCEIFAPG